MTIDQQREYVAIIREMWQKTIRVCGTGSDPASAMLIVLLREERKLDEMRKEAENESA